MVINKKLKSTFLEISKAATDNANTPDKNRAYLKRLLSVFDNSLSDEERLLIVKYIIENLHYKSIITDPDNIIQLQNIRLRGSTYYVFLALAVVIGLAYFFKFGASITNMLTSIEHVFKLLSI